MVSGVIVCTFMQYGKSCVSAMKFDLAPLLSGLQIKSILVRFLFKYYCVISPNNIIILRLEKTRLFIV